jgi:cobalt-zinc-cadmium efflux system outer membrane protein
MKQCIYLQLILSLVLVANSQEQSAPTAPPPAALSLEGAVRSALTNNLWLQAARFAISEAEARLSAAGRLPNPELESAFAPTIGGGERTFTVGFNQSLPVTSRLRIEKRLSVIDLNLARAELADFERSLAFQVRTTAVTLATITAQQRLNTNQRENSRVLQDTVRRSVQAAETSNLDLAQLELEASHLNLRQLQLKSLQSELLVELALLLGSSNSSNLDLALSLPPANFASLETDLQKRSDFQAARHRTEAAQENVSLARAQRWRDIEVGAFTEIDRNEDVPNGLETDHIVGVRVAIPLPLWNNGKARIAEANAARARREHEESALRARVSAEVASARAHLQAAHDLLKVLQQDLLPKARNIEERFTAAHAQGLSTFFDVLRARERRLQLESAELDAQRDLHLAHARLLHATGTTLLE